MYAWSWNTSSSSVKKLIQANNFSLNLHPINSKMHKKLRLLSSEIHTRLASSAPSLKISNNYIVPLYDLNVNSNTLAEGKNTLPKVCRSLWSLLCEIFLHYFVRLKLQNFGTDLFSLMKEKKKTISMPTDVFLCPASLISSPVNTFASNSTDSKWRVYTWTDYEKKSRIFVCSQPY